MEISPESRGMLKILQSTTIANRLGILLLTPMIILPCRAANTPTLTTLYSFTDLSDGGAPEAGLVISTGGALFGTTSSGGSGWGSVFELIPAKGGTWTEATLYSFTGGADGGNPIADLVIGKNNVLYGTTYWGGAHGYGTVFQLAPSQGGVWTEKVLYSFANGSDGANPATGLALTSTGVLYGTTYNGGASNLGTVFELIPSVSGWTEKVLYAFQGSADGSNPLTDLVVASTGSLYGTTSQGGSGTNSGGTYSNEGTIFELTPKGGGVWTETVLYTFTGGSDGSYPQSPLIIGANSVLYGSAFWGGAAACPVSDYPQGCGTIFQLIPPTGTGTTWTLSVIYAFTGHSSDGAHPYGKMALNTSGELFGTTYSGGANVNTCMSDAFSGCGSVFSAKPPSKTGGKWTKSNITVFPGSPGGGTPTGVTLSTGGSMYGTTISGGNTGGYGTVFLMTP